MASRLRVALTEPVRLEGMTFDLDASIGIALYPDHAPDFELLLQRSDVAMYMAKEARSGVEFYVAERDRNSPGTPQPARRPAPGHRPGRTRPALPAQGGAPGRPRRGRRGAPALVASGTRPRLARRVHPAGRAVLFDAPSSPNT